MRKLRTGGGGVARAALRSLAFWRLGIARRVGFRPLIHNGKGTKTDRRLAHQMLDRLGPTQFNAVSQLLELLAAGPDSLRHSLSQAPIEEEEITAETAAALDRGRASLARGEGIPHEEILREFGLTK